jgi:two-component system, NtrC family, sensor histidine kinase KinB
MITTLRTKMLIGVMPLLALMVGLGLWAITLFSRLGNNIDVILRENYRSVIAAQGMKESLERMDSALWFAIGGKEDRAKEQFRESRKIFGDKLRSEQNNVTLPGEQAMADDLTTLHARYLAEAEKFFVLSPEAKAERTAFYFERMLPLFDAIKRRADDVLEINQTNMTDENDRARQTAESSTRWMLFALMGSAAVASLIAIAASRAILEPIRAVTRAARGMAKGNLDQVVPSTTHDELGELAEAFNEMARTIRNFRQAGTARLLRAQQTAQATIDSIPDPVIVVDPTGLVERANPAARRVLGVATADVPSHWTAPIQLREPLAEVLSGKFDRWSIGLEHALACRDDGQERFFLPHVLAIRDDAQGLLGAAIVLTDVTRFRLLDQLKSDMVSTVSHELKTPLTGVQMTVHLLLEEIVGPLNAKQIELLLAARQDADRLLAMINDLLDLTRIEQGRVRLDREQAAPADLITEAIERFESKAKDGGITLKGSVAFGLPPVSVDRERISHVFDNLIGNALSHTPRNGSVELSSRVMKDGSIEFSVEDSGVGIAPEHLPRIFEKFYRVPGSKTSGGAGLGLAIAREIVEAHGGRIEAESHGGRGTIFTFTLPTAPAEGSNGDTALHEQEGEPTWASPSRS